VDEVKMLSDAECDTQSFLTQGWGGWSTAVWLASLAAVQAVCHTLSWIIQVVCMMWAGV